MRIKHIKSGRESQCTEAEWRQIQENGFAQDFKVLEKVKAPSEVQQAIEGQEKNKEKKN